MRVLSATLVVACVLSAQVVITPTVGKQITTPKKRFQDDEVLLGVGIQTYINDNFAVDMRVEASDSNYMADGGRTDLERGSLNALYEFLPTKKFSPYLLGGVGYEKLHRTFKELKSQPFYQVGAGFKVDLTKRLEFITETKYIKKTDTKVDEVVATCGFGVKLGSDECEVSCDSLKKSLEPKPKIEEAISTPKPAVKSLKEKAVTTLTTDDTYTFSDEVGASKTLLGKKSFTKPTANYVQVASLSKSSNLKNMLKKLKSKGFKVKTIKKGRATTVLVGPYKKTKISAIYQRIKAIQPDAFYKKL